MSLRRDSELDEEVEEEEETADALDEVRFLVGLGLVSAVRRSMVME